MPYGKNNLPFFLKAFLLRTRVGQALQMAVYCAFVCLIPDALSKSPRPADTPASRLTGSLDGKLTDNHSLPLTQAIVVVRNLATGESVRAITGKNGSYRFTGLDPGEYRLEADVPQLGKGAVEGILVSAAHATRVQAALVLERPALPSSDAELHSIDPVAPAVTTMLDEEELNAVPVTSRNWQGFAALTPASNPAHSGRNQIGEDDSDEPESESLALGAATAAQPSGSSSNVDGLDNTPAFHASRNRSVTSGQLLGASAALIMEVKSGSLPAEASSSPGGSSNITTGPRSAPGSRGVHGQAYYLNRQSLWAALNPYSQRFQETEPTSGIDIAQFTPEPYTPGNNRQTFGLGIGGPLKRGKLSQGNLFLFASLDGSRDNDPAVASVRHPTDFFSQPLSPELSIFSDRLNLPGPAYLEQAAAAFADGPANTLGLQQLQKSIGLTQLTTLLGPVPRTATEWQGFSRLDWQASERQHLSLEAISANFDSPGGALSRATETYGSHSFGNSKSAEDGAIVKLESFLTANLLNQAAIQYRRSVQGDTAQSPAPIEQQFIANPWGQLPEIVADSKYGFILGKPARLGGSGNPDERAIVAQDTVSWVRGAHLLKFGGSLIHISDFTDTLVNQTGTYSYSSLVNFLSDADSFLQYGFSSVQNPNSLIQHNCYGQTGQYNDDFGGLGYYPCYSWYSQRIGPTNWSLSTNDLAAFATEQWQPFHRLTLSVGVRTQAQQLPAPIANLQNPYLPQTEKLPGTHVDLAPRVGLAWSPAKGTVLRLGAGLYYGRIDNAVVLAALTQTGSLNGDLNFFFRPTDGGAPPFPYVFPTEPTTTVTPGAVSLAPRYRTQQIDQAVFSLEQALPSHWLISVTAQASLGRRLPVSVDTNFDRTQGPTTITYAVVDKIQAGPIKAQQVTVPFYPTRLDTKYQQLASIESRANSTYDAALIKLVRYGGHGFTFRAHYLYAHATDWNPNESARVASGDTLDPENFGLEYGTSNLDIRHSGGLTLLYRTPWKLHNWAGNLANDWSVATVGQYRSGLPFTMRTGGSIPGFFNGSDELIEGVGPGMNGSGGDNRVYGIGRNTYRYPATYTGDARLGKRFDLAKHREFELLAESFNLLNHQNVTRVETTGYYIDRGTVAGGLPSLNFHTGLNRDGTPSASPEFGKPLDINATNFYHPREFQLGLRTRF